MIVPEKLEHRARVRGAIHANFWDQPVQSTRSLDGLARTLPCEPPPLTQTCASGLSRTQQLLALQALWFPCVPSYDADMGGLVLDRVMGKTGGPNWWLALLGRARAQQMYAAHRRGNRVGQTLKDLNNYSLCARTHVGVGKSTTLNAIGEAGGPVARGQAWLKRQLPGHELQASAAWNSEFLDSAAAYCVVPLALALDVGSTQRADGIQYRLGLHHVSATEGVPGAEARGGPGSLSSPRGPADPPLRSALHFQGAVAVEGEAVLWHPTANRPPWGTDSGLGDGPDAAGADSDGTESGDWAAELHPEVAKQLDAALAQIGAAREALGEGTVLAGVSAGGIQSDVAGARGTLERARGRLAALTGALRDGLLGRKRRQSLRARPRPPRRQPYSPWLAQPYIKVNAAVGCLARIPLPTGAFRPFDGQPTSPTQPAAAGAKAAPELDAARRRKRRVPPRFGAEMWAPYLRDTALRVFASFGASAQVGRFSRPFFDYTAAAARLDLGLTSPQAQWLADGGGTSAGGTAGAGARSAADDWLDSGGGDYGEGGLQAAGPLLKHRAFALEGRGIWHALSVSAAQQLVGPLRLRADFRLALEPPAAPPVPPNPRIPSPKGGRRGGAGLGNGGAGGARPQWQTLEVLADAVRGMRATPLEAVYGLDLALPGSGGAARAAAWWSPARREAQIELRLF
ncbi:hypothetical protein WJX81_003011 [Elliptochloris bilobata]|uniref:Uncharacterized protein n=1 Tax=Elliptochloris bilobata TaxID=381761 RepID=A0AAW1SCZ8_9CHLO